MTRNQRMSTFSIVTIATALYAVACSSSDPPDPSSSAGGSTATTGPSGTGGSTGPAATTAPTNGGATSPAGGAGSQGGDTSTPSTSTDVGGATAAGGSTGAGQTEFLPLCGLTLAGVEAKKGTACTAADVQLCYRSCGPLSVGFKSETCNSVSAIYEEKKDECLYPAAPTTATGDYSCFKVPATLPDATTCAITAAPKSGDPCTAPACTLCSLNGAYLDSGGAGKVGHCVCNEKTDGTKTWSCATTAIWPCPGKAGC